jgi:hypothetical protein
VSGSPPSASQEYSIPEPARRWRIRHPWIALASGIGFLLIALTDALGAFTPFGNTDAFTPVGGTLITIGGLLAFAAWIAAIVVTIRLRRWVWLVVVFLLSLYAGLVFGIFGPTTKRQSKMLAPQAAARQ